MPRRNHRHLKSFTHWLTKNQHRFLLPVKLQKIGARKTKLVFPELPKVIGIGLSTWNLSVHVTWEERCMDLLLDLDCMVHKTFRGYQCELCERPREIWTTLEAMYVDHLYEPFLSWVNEALHPATGVAIYEMRGSTWAELMCVGNAEPTQENLKTYVPFGLPIYREQKS